MDEEIEKAVLDLMGDDLMKDLLIRALIASHPTPKAARYSFEALLSAHESEIQEQCFSLGRDPETVARMLVPFRALARKWLAYFPRT